MSRNGYVLVGGRSSRMGRDKALLPFRGRSLGQSVARQVELAAGNVALVGNAGTAGRLGYLLVPDLYPGEGPLGGILTALRHTAADWNLIVACDMPELRVELLLELLDEAERSDAAALIPAGPSGRPEPLCAVYHRRGRPALEAAFGRGIRRVMAAVAELPAVVYEVAEVAPFQNVNTPEEWAVYDSERRT